MEKQEKLKPQVELVRNKINLESLAEREQEKGFLWYGLDIIKNMSSIREELAKSYVAVFGNSKPDNNINKDHYDANLPI